VNKTVLLLTILCTLSLHSACDLLYPGGQFHPMVKTKSGTIEGVEGETSLYFKGIPYAEPPVGSLRWQAPLDKTPWQDTLKAKEFSKACPQISPSYVEEPVEWDEDCLCLNIYRPKENTKDLPVMMFIHGGSFMDGAGSLATYDGEWLAQNKKIVLVTINYRLRDLGFLYLPEAGITGNFGIRDQIKALEWLNSNIKAFGGDPENITVFGESAGGISIGLLLAIAPELFHKAIIQSGFIYTNPETISEENALGEGQRFVQEIGCEGAQDMAACLRSKSTEEVLAITTESTPVLDGELIADMPLSLIVEGEGKNIPLIMGVNEDEGGFFALAFGIKTEDDYENWVYDNYPDSADQILSMYPASNYANPTRAAAAVFADSLFVCPTRKALTSLSEVSNRLYHYLFTYPPEVGRELGVGAFHGAELYYIFHTFEDEAGEAEQVSQNISTLWTTFAYEGTPSCGDTTWEPFTSLSQAYLTINSELSTGMDLKKEQCDLLDCCDWYFP
jgi:para-nitrobenzyl esterase